MQHLETSGTPVLYIGRTVLKSFLSSPSDRNEYQEYVLVGHLYVPIV
jgi:hypothetical protein